MQAYHLLSAEFLKYRRHPSLLLLLFPLLIELATALLFVNASMPWDEALVGGGMLLRGLFGLPLTGVLLAGAFADVDRSSGIARGLYTRPVSPWALYGAKLVNLLLFSWASTCLCLVPTCVVVLGWGVGDNPPFGALLIGTLLSWLATLPFTILSLWLATAWGSNAAFFLLFGLVGGAASATIPVFALPVWVPLTWPMGVMIGYLDRFSSLALDRTPYPLLPVLTTALVTTIILTITSSAWFEGRERY